jgi:hypothetical protein
MSARRFLADRRGTAATEMALLVPLLLTLMFGGFEAGHFVWTQHKLAEAVRDGARFAARLEIDSLCDKTSVSMTDDIKNQIILLTRTGQIANADASPKVPGWQPSSVDVEVDCNPSQALSSGLYSDLGTDDAGSPLRGPIVTVAAKNVAYPSFFGQLGIIDPARNMKLTASSHAPVIGL